MDLKQSEALLATVNDITQLSQLRAFRHQFQQAFEQSTFNEEVVQSNDVINKMHDSLIKRSIQLAELEMIGEGLGPPPSPYCYLLLGSGGRYEQTFGSDQDSALLFEHTDGNLEEHQLYFLKLANKVVQSLEQIGYSPCDGKVQSNVPMWCKDFSSWKEQVIHWFNEADWESIRYLLICSDARIVYGEKELYSKYQQFFYEEIQNTPHIYQRMIDNTIHHKVMVNVFGQLLTVKYGEQFGSIDIKYGAYIPFVNAIRWLAIRHGITATSTLQRLEQLYLLKQFTDDEYLEYRKVFIQFLQLRLLAGFVGVGDYYESFNMIHPKKIEKEVVSELKRNLQLGRKLQKHIQYFIRHSK